MVSGLWVNSLTNDKILGLSLIEDEKLKVTQKLVFLFRGTENIVVKGENADYRHFSPISQHFSFSSLYWWGLLTLSQTTNLDSSKLKEFADDNFQFDENERQFSKRVENTVGKGKIAH